MTCDICGKKEATVHLTEIVNDKMTKLHLCEECAKEKGAEMEEHFGLSDLLAGLTDLGSTVEPEVMEMIKDAMAGWIELHLIDGVPVPEPAVPSDFSGNFVVRAPKALHRDLARRAQAEGTSLNQYVITTLSRALGVQEGREQYKVIRRRSLSATKKGIKK